MINTMKIPNMNTKVEFSSNSTFTLQKDAFLRVVFEFSASYAVAKFFVNNIEFGHAFTPNSPYPTSISVPLFLPSNTKIKTEGVCYGFIYYLN